ncbi:MAG: chemotaxis protein CheB [Proteobacteria bacterium]|nr:chemotaxis protein CheB [Pseudomonadota bacterium]
MLNRQVVGLIHLGEKQSSATFLTSKLIEAGYAVTQYFDMEFDKIEDVNVFIINLSENCQNIDDVVEKISKTDAQIIFNDAMITNGLAGWNKNRWIRHLLNKIDESHNLFPDEVLDNNSSTEQVRLDEFGVEHVWILAASIGGPEALVKFFGEFEGDEPILFIVVQHMDKEFMHMMEKQLNKNNSIEVKLAEFGVQVAPGLALLIPVDEGVLIRQDGKVDIKDIVNQSITTPCIDDICMDFIDNLSQLNMAIFSGMATDGVKGAINVHGNGGKIITQSANSCVVSAIAQEIRDRNYSLFDGDPVAMAKYIKQSISNTGSEYVE